MPVYQNSVTQIFFCQTALYRMMVTPVCYSLLLSHQIMKKKICFTTHWHPDKWCHPFCFSFVLFLFTLVGFSLPSPSPKTESLLLNLQLIQVCLFMYRLAWRYSLQIDNFTLILIALYFLSLYIFWVFNTLRPRLNGCHLPDNLFKKHFLEWKCMDFG